MDMKTYTLDKVIKWLIGGELFNSIKEMVLNMADTELTGEEKRAKVLQEAKSIAGKTASFLLNLGIEAAVVILKSKVK